MDIIKSCVAAKNLTWLNWAFSLEYDHLFDVKISDL
jgi:hypothetical protein